MLSISSRSPVYEDTIRYLPTRSNLPFEQRMVYALRSRMLDQSSGVNLTLVPPCRRYVGS